MAWVIFDNFMENQHDGNAINLDVGGDTIKCMLIDDTRAPVQATDENMVDIDNNEVSGTNYTAGGQTLANQICSLSASIVSFDCDDFTWAQSPTGFSDARYAVVYYSTGTPANDRVIVYADLGGDVGNTTEILTLELNPSGIWTLTNS